MFRLIPLISALQALVVLGNPQLPQPIYSPDSLDSDILATKKEIEANIKLAPLPKTARHPNLREEVPCIMDLPLLIGWGHGCTTVEFFTVTRHKSLKGNVTAVGEISVDVFDFDTKSTAAEITLTESTAVMDSISTGYSYSFQLVSNQFGKLGGGASYERNEQETKTTTKTSEVRVSFTCPPWSRCSIATVTWHVLIATDCETVPMYLCDDDKVEGAVEVCKKDRASLICESYRTYHKEVCPPKNSCVTKVPLLNRALKPATSYKPDFRDRRSRFVKCRWEEDGRVFAILSNGLAYDFLETKKFLNVTDKNAEWVDLGPDYPPPYIPSPRVCDN
ncbi:hypothetical protein CDD83_4057 [Cordyceps sp. RAO-2017]|nr:hypothetical protein CDD83_4057 [Cordyceps sp. RAO-2017]